jgi:hypothetical protein
MSRPVIVALTGAAVVLACVAAPAPANAADSRLAGYQQANAAVRKTLAAADGPTPSLGDPAYAKQVADAFDLQVIDVLKDQPLGDVLTQCAEAGRTEAAFADQGLAKAAAGLDPQAAGLRRLRVRAGNSMTFQDELAAAKRFDIACSALEAEKMDAFVAALSPEQLTPTRRSSLAEIQKAFEQLVSATALNMLTPVRAANRETVLQTLADHIGPLASGLNQASRAKARTTIDNVLKQQSLSKAARDRLAVVRRSLDQADCNALCRAS